MTGLEPSGETAVGWSPTHRRDVRDTLEDGLARGHFTPAERDVVKAIARDLRVSGRPITRDQARAVERLLVRLVTQGR